MSSFTLAAASSVLGARGPIAVEDVDQGAVVCGLDRSGSLVTAEVVGSLAQDERPGVRLLTRCGDVLVPGATRVAGFRGPLVASTIRPGPTQLDA